MEMEYLKIYNSFLEELTLLNYLDNEYLHTLINESDKTKINKGTHFCVCFTNVTNFNYLLKCKIKLFSHKSPDCLLISEGLFGKTLSLKKIFNNQPNDIKQKLWSILHNLVLSVKKIHLNSLSDDTKLLPCCTKLQDDITKLEKTINEYIILSAKHPVNDTRKYINKIIDNTSLDNPTSELINDIVKSFEDTMNTGTNNPFQNIMKINELISSKYHDKIENGEINLNEILGSLQKNIPILGETSAIGNMLSSFSDQPVASKDTVVMDENFSTADIDQGILPDNKPNMVIGNVLKTVGSLTGNSTTPSQGPDIGNLMGMIGNITGNSSKTPDIGSLMNMFANTEGKTNEPDINKLMSIFSGMGLNDETNTSDIQNMLQKNLGIDINTLTKQMSDVLDKKEN